MRWRLAGCLLSLIAVTPLLAAQQPVNQGRTAEECADAQPRLAEYCRTIGALLPRSASGFGESTAGLALTPMTTEDRAPADPSRLHLLPLLRWDPRANGFQTSVPSGSCWLEGAGGSIMRCAFDFGRNRSTAIERYEELRTVLHELAPASWRYTTSPVSVLFSNGEVVRAALHLANFAAPDWVADTPDARWRVVMSLGRLGKHAELPEGAWAAPVEGPAGDAGDARE